MWTICAEKTRLEEENIQFSGGKLGDREKENNKQRKGRNKKGIIGCG